MAVLDNDGNGIIDYQEFVEDMKIIDHQVGNFLGDPQAQRKAMASALVKDKARDGARGGSNGHQEFASKKELLAFIAQKVEDKSKLVREVFR